MRLHGTLEANLIAAIRSARRLRGHPVHPDTVTHWNELLHEARRELTSATYKEMITELVVELEIEVAEHVALQ
jgi:hypothetical protein